ncbi:plasmid pRiA4b ORF-3 family protein [Alkalibacillus haloalkaliphilus]|uniref:TnpR protein n=1 Tax=Alkalibacillus haloalkaliphilus TaxID=94136 RepID=A0A511W6C4_9BACI|nr:plasmid pRiA4b ORF-3 family protein [Alkalibacillus haloalkaliphilus]GEN46644.1 hypothetical protein AHA02nite_24200 [Alkalibacillus haloalkaliphilus]
MQIQCTKKLLNELKVEADERIERDSIFDWHANVFKIGRRKAIVLLNDVSRYSILLYGVKADDFRRLSEAIPAAISEVLEAEGIDSSVIDEYIRSAGAVTFTNTKSRKLVSAMTQRVKELEMIVDDFSGDEKVKVDISKHWSRFLTGDGQGSYIFPKEEMIEELEKFASRPIFSSDAYEVKVSLPLGDHTAWRRLVVKSDTTFSEFHEIIQSAFNWESSHLYEFLIDGKEIEYGSESMAEPLSGWLEGVSEFQYIYDFGDFWEHHVEVARKIEGYSKQHATCIDGEHPAPPEDVGGMPGYSEFLRIINDKNDPDHMNMKSWARWWKPEFDIEWVNRKLERMT